MNRLDRSAGYQLLEIASLIDFKTGESILQAGSDGENLFLKVGLVLGNDEKDPADIAEWAPFGLIYALRDVLFH